MLPTFNSKSSCLVTACVSHARIYSGLSIQRIIASVKNKFHGIILKFAAGSKIGTNNIASLP